VGGAKNANAFAERLAQLGLPANTTFAALSKHRIADFSDGFGSDLMGDAEDRATIAGLKEIEREGVLQERGEARNRETQNVVLRVRVLEQLRKDMGAAEKKGGARKGAAAGMGAKAKAGAAEEGEEEDEEDEEPRKPVKKAAKKPSQRKSEFKRHSSDEEESESSGSSDSDSSSGSSSSSSDADSDASGLVRRKNLKKGKGGKAAPRRVASKKPLRKAAPVSDSEEGEASDASEASEKSGGKKKGKLSKKEEMQRQRDSVLKGGARGEEYDEGEEGEEKDDEDEDMDSEFASDDDAMAVDDGSFLGAYGASAPVARDSGPDLRAADLADIETIHICRRQALEHMSSPAFKDMVSGTFVKWPKDYGGRRPPTEADVAAGLQSKYRIGRVVGVVRVGGSMYDPWKNDLEMLKNGKRVDKAGVVRSTNLALHVGVGSSKEVELAAAGGAKRTPRTLRLSLLSNSGITPLEWSEYASRLAQQYQNDGKKLEDKEVSKWEVGQKASEWAAALATASYSTVYVDKVLAEREKSATVDMSRTLNPTVLRTARQDKLDGLSEKLKALAKEEEMVRQELAQAVAAEGAGEEDDALDDGLGGGAEPAAGQGGSGGAARSTAAGTLGALTKERIQLETSADGVRAELRAIDEEEAKRRARAGAIVAAKLAAGRNVSVLTSLVNDRIIADNAARMTMAADMERGKDLSAELAEIDDNPFLRRKTQPTNLFRVARKAGEAPPPEVAPPPPVAAPKEEGVPKRERLDLAALLDDGPAGFDRAGAGAEAPGGGAADALDDLSALPPDAGLMAALLRSKVTGAAAPPPPAGGGLKPGGSISLAAFRAKLGTQ